MRVCAISRPARWQRGVQRYQRRKRATACSKVRTSSDRLDGAGGDVVVQEQRHHRLRHQVNRLMCRHGNLEESLKQRAVRVLAARHSRPTMICKEARVPPWKRQSQRCLDGVSERLLLASPRSTAS